jgi:hypothetical protein
MEFDISEGGYKKATRKARTSDGIQNPCRPASQPAILLAISVLEKPNWYFTHINGRTAGLRFL